MDGESHTNGKWFDCDIGVSWYGDSLKIKDVNARTERRGYARILLTYIIQIARQKGIKRIYGELSCVDKHQFDWLIPFYESLGFKTTLYKEPKGCIVGKIEGEFEFSTL